MDLRYVGRLCFYVIAVSALHPYSGSHTGSVHMWACIFILSHCRCQMFCPEAASECVCVCASALSSDTTVRLPYKIIKAPGPRSCKPVHLVTRAFFSSCFSLTCVSVKPLSYEPLGFLEMNAVCGTPALTSVTSQDRVAVFVFTGMKTASLLFSI